MFTNLTYLSTGARIVGDRDSYHFHQLSISPMGRSARLARVLSR